MATPIFNKANQETRTFADFVDVDSRYDSVAQFEAAIPSPRIPDGWPAYCKLEEKWYYANKATGKAVLRKITDQDAQLNTNGSPKFASVEVNGGSPTVFRKTIGAGAGSALKIITGSPANAVGSVLDLAAANPEGIETAITFYSVTPATGAAPRQLNIILPPNSGQLATLGDIIQHYKGKYLSLDALQAVPGTDGDYALIDAGPGIDAVEYIWDSTDDKWTPSSNKGASTFGQLGGNPTDNASLAAALALKVDKVTGKQLSTEDYTTIDRNKVANVPADTVSSLANKVDKVTGKQLSTNDYTTDEKNKLGSIYKEYNLIFVAPYNSLGGEYFKAAAQIKSILLFGASAFSYSIDNGASYFTPVLPLTPSTYINIPAGKLVKWRVTFAANSTNATAFLEFN